MGKRSSRELVGDIAGALSDEAQSIQDIADKVGADRQSVTKYLEELKDAGIVKEEKSGRSRKFRVSEYEDRDAYFGLSLTDDQRGKFRDLFNRIFEAYYREFGKTPSKLMSQKIAVKVIKELDLELPFGRYQYGAITPMNPDFRDSQGPVSFPVGDQELDDKVEETVVDYGNRGFQEARLKQYREEGMELYETKEDIMEMLASDISFTKGFEKMLYAFLAKTPEMDEDIEDYLVDFIAVSTDLVGEASHRAKVMEAFKEFWELVALHCFEEDMREYYDEAELRSRMESHKDERKDEVEQAMSELISLHEEVVEYDIDEEMEKLKGSAEELSEEEKERREEELEDMDSSDLSREFGLDS